MNVFPIRKKTIVQCQYMFTVEAFENSDSESEMNHYKCQFPMTKKGKLPRNYRESEKMQPKEKN